MSHNVRKFGALGDGVTLDQAALQSALDSCHLTGGGTVEVPAGRYLTGTLRLKSNVRLQLDAGAVLLASEDPSLYPVICKTPFGNLPGHIQAVLWADEAQNVTVCGPGIVDGGKNEIIEGRPEDAHFRPALVFFRNCRDVRFLDATFQYTSFWTLHLLRCQDVYIRGITIRTHMQRFNTDGIDPDGCRNVFISDCLIESGDDSIVVKSTEGDPCENILVSNCVLSSSCAALKIGTEAMGPIRDVSFRNCRVHTTNVALALYMYDGGVYENIAFEGISIEADNEFPIFVDSMPRYHGRSGHGLIRNVSFRNLQVRGKGRMFIGGSPGRPAENISIDGLAWDIDGALNPQAQRPLGARRTELDPAWLNKSLPHHQLLLRHIDGLDARGIRLFDRRETALPDRGLAHLEGVRRGILNIPLPIQVPREMEPVEQVDSRSITTHLGPFPG